MENSCYFGVEEISMLCTKMVAVSTQNFYGNLAKWSNIPYSRLFWQALKLANWSKNVIGEF